MSNSTQSAPVYTVGYGSRSFDNFLSLLKKYRIDYLVDVRSKPYSRFNPAYTKENLEENLRKHYIRYVFMGETLGGQPSDDSCYTDGKVDYLKCREKPFFVEGIGRIQTAWQKQVRVALMCSEGRPEDCHRSKLIGEALRSAGVEVAHIDENTELKSQDDIVAMLTKGQSDLFGSMFTSRKRYRAGP
jgi:uncharacterized protein (DUF488 family)